MHVLPLLKFKVYIDRVKTYQVYQNYLNWPKRHLKLVHYSIHIHLNQWQGLHRWEVTYSDP